MAKNVQVKVDPTLIDVFGRVGRSFAEKIKKEYNLKELFVPNTLASQIIAGQYNGKKNFNFRVRKTGINKGILEIIN